MNLSLKWTEFIPHDPMRDIFPKQFAFLALPHREAFYGGAAGGGKVLYDDALILTPSGFQEGRSLQVGDLVNSPDGSITSIAYLHPRMKYRTWRVHFHDGTHTDVAKEHLWLAWRSGLGKGKANRVFGESSSQVISTKQLKDWCEIAKTQKEQGKRPYWPCIPVCEAQRFSEPHKRGLAIDPYLLGFWLGDGHGGDNLGFTSMDCDHLRKHLSEAGETWSEHRKQGTDALQFLVTGRSRKRWRLTVKMWGLKEARAESKYIPNYVKYGSLENRLAVLQGLMDTDGTVDDRGQCYYTTVSKQLAEDVKFVVQSLGGTATIFSKQGQYTHLEKGIVECQLAYTLYIKLKDESQLFRLKRKQKRCQSSNMYRRVVHVEQREEYRVGRCITVANPNGLYITNDFIVTHNSEALLIGGLQYVDIPGYSALIFRRTLSDLKQAQALLDRASQWLGEWPKDRVRYSASEHCYYFSTWYPDGTPGTPARLQFGYIGTGNAKTRYKSAEYQYIAFDELTTFSEDDYLFMFSRLRRIKCPEHSDGKPDNRCYRCLSSAGVPLRIRAASNPGDIGHRWVKERYAIEPRIINGIKRFVGGNSERPFIAANFRDNPHIDQDTYESNLKEMDPISREQFMNGDWGVSQDSRFKLSWFRRYSIRGEHYILGLDGRGPICHQKELQIFFTVDPAASAKEGPGDNKRFDVEPSWTVIAVWGLTPDMHLLLLEVIRFRKEIPEVLAELIAAARRWRPSRIATEAVGVGKGVFQMAQRRGLPVFPLHPHTDKLVRSTEAQLRASQGKIWLPQLPGPGWLPAYEGEISTWTGDPGEQDDQIDVTSDAARLVSWEAVGSEMETADLGGIDIPTVISYYGSQPGIPYI